MNIGVDDEQLATMKFAVGQPVRRNEDMKLIQGLGAYSDDLALPGQAYLAMVRARAPHGLIRAIDADAARAMPGVLAIYTGADLMAAGYGPYPYRVALKNRDDTPLMKPKRYALATDRVSYVGDSIAFVIADTAARAEDAAEAVIVDIESLPAVVDMREAVKPGAPQIVEGAANNVALDYHFGDAAKTAAAFAEAAHVTRMRLIDNRIVVNAMEPRACLAAFDGENGRFTLWASSQGVAGSRANTAEMMNVAPDKLRFVAVNVGGSFGLKGSTFPEYICALHAARDLGKPIKWNDTRSGSFLSDHHGRDQDFDCEMALDKDGHILAIRCTGFGNLGAYMTMLGPLFSTLNIAKHVNGAYRTPLIEVSTRCVFTNTVPITAYRGAGRPEGNYFLERLIDTAAREMAIDPIEIRRRNHIARDQMPYRTASGSTYDSGDFPAILERAVIESDWRSYSARKAESERRGKLRGRGVGQFVEVTAPVTGELGDIRFDVDGFVTLRTGSHDHGQGHWTTFAQVLGAQLGVPFDKIRLMQTDSDELRMGSGTGGSKSLMCSGTAIVEASEMVIEKGKIVASHLLEAGVGDIEFNGGDFAVVGTDRAINIMDMARQLRAGSPLPPDAPTSLDVDHTSSAKPATFPNGCHVCEVEIDPETGVVEIAKYTMVGDFGVVVNPMIVEAQVQGGVMQGIGQCLMEQTIYTEDGQLATGSFMDYAMPRAADGAVYKYVSLPQPATTNPLGVKGCGEAGCAGSMTSIMNAVVDALQPVGVKHIDMPATPKRVWDAIRAARG